MTHMTEDSVAQTYGAWKLIGSADVTGKRSIVRCVVCGSVQTVSREQLMTSHVTCAGGCSPVRNPADRHNRSFAADAASAEGRSARKRHQGRGEDA